MISYAEIVRNLNISKYVSWQIPGCDPVQRAVRVCLINILIRVTNWVGPQKLIRPDTLLILISAPTSATVVFSVVLFSRYSAALAVTLLCLLCEELQVFVSIMPISCVSPFSSNLWTKWRVFFKLGVNIVQLEPIPRLYFFTFLPSTLLTWRPREPMMEFFDAVGLRRMFSFC